MNAADSYNKIASSATADKSSVALLSQNLDRKRRVTPLYSCAQRLLLAGILVSVVCAVSCS